MRTVDDVRNELDRKTSLVATSGASRDYTPEQILTAAVLLLGDQLRDISQRLSELDNSVDNIAKAIRDAA